MKTERAPALTEGLRIIEKAIASGEPITFESILDGIEMSRSSASRLLKVLVDSGYLTAIKGHLGGYIPGIRLFSLVQHLSQNQTSQFNYLGNQMQLLSQKTKTSIQYTVLDRAMNRIMVLRKAESEDSLKIAGYGFDATYNICRYAVGKLILAYCNNEERKALMSNYKPEKLTKHTTVPGPKLDRLLEQVRKCGYAEDIEEHGYHLFRTALPVFSSDGKIAGGICSVWYAPSFDKNIAADLRKGLRNIVDFLNMNIIDNKILKK